MFVFLILIVLVTMASYGIWKYSTRIENLIPMSLEPLEYPIESLEYPLTPLNYPIESLEYPLTPLNYPMVPLNYPMESLKYPIKTLDYPSTRLVPPIESLKYPLVPLKPVPTPTPHPKPHPKPSKYGPNHSCSSDSQCKSGACAHATADKGAKTVCCPSGNSDLFGGFYYCTGMKSGSTCWSDAMCASGDCKGNWSGLKRGKCT